jgi:AP-1 complex subunit sigma 1/2
MKFLPTPDLDALSGALNFDTSDCNVTGACELYSTKSSGSDKKLLRQIDQELSDRHDEISKSLPRFESNVTIASSPNMHMFTKDSAFGPLQETMNRRTFAYLIATLNASHPHYEFSNCLRPIDFKKLPDISEVSADIEANLHRFRHSTLDRGYDGVTGPEGAKSAVWGPTCWFAIDREIDLACCDIFRYSPESDPFKDDEGAVWSAHYLFFNRDHKRVVYLYARMVPVLSSQSPPSQPVGSLKRSLSGMAMSGGAHKRARFWLGDTDPSLIEFADQDDEDDGFCWNRDEDGQMMMADEEGYSPVQGASTSISDDEGYDDDYIEDDAPPSTLNKRATYERETFRSVAEDLASRMEM